MLAQIYAALHFGLNVHIIEVEVDVRKGNLPTFSIVGLPDTSVKEAKERVRAALHNSGIQLPWQRVILVNLAPADLKKEGPVFDLPIALGLMKACEYPLETENSLFLGELSLDGKARSVLGVLPCVLYAKEHGFSSVYVPHQNAKEASLVKGINVFAVHTLKELVSHLLKGKEMSPFAAPEREEIPEKQRLDMAHVRGHHHAKRALEIATAGGHNVLLTGPPGSGKTLLAKTAATILPSPTEEEVLEITKIYSIAGMLQNGVGLMSHRPFRAPHHTASHVALVGGGKVPRPGEITLAHRGVLFLDELPEFSRGVLECLRQPLEDGVVTISRAAAHVTYPAEFMLIAAQNPCPCGYFSDPEKECVCSMARVQQYQSRVSGPFLDRMDLHVDVPRLPSDKMMGNGEDAEQSSKIRARVENARTVQRARFKSSGGTNAKMSSDEVEKNCSLANDERMLLKAALEHYTLSPRAYYKILKVSRTIADLAGLPEISADHISESLQYRF